MTIETCVVPPFTVHSVGGYGRTAWQVRAGGGHIVSRMNAEKSAREVARLLNLASCDTHPKDGDVKQAPALLSGAVPQGDAPNTASQKDSPDV